MIRYRNDLPVHIATKELDDLERAARTAGRRRARLILHRDHDDPIQEMVIAITADAYIMPHRQLRRLKSYVLLRGGLRVLFFDRAGNIHSHAAMGAGGEETSVLRFDAGQWHSLVCTSETAVYIEIAQGPFEGSEWAKWAPKDENSPEAQAYLQFMKTRSLSA